MTESKVCTELPDRDPITRIGPRHAKSRAVWRVIRRDGVDGASVPPQALIDSRMQALGRDADDGVRELCRQCLLRLWSAGLVAAGRNLGRETERVSALVDGLTSHLVTGHTTR